MEAITASGDDYSQVLHALRPQGPAMVGEDELLEGLAQEFARAHNRLNDLLRESDPRTTFDMLTDWERAAGLPDECCGAGASYEARISSLVNRILGAATPTPQYFIDLALRAGYVITITEFDPFTVGSTIDGPIYPEDIVFVWQVNAPEESVSYFTAISGVDSALAAWGNTVLECIMNRAKPAHTFVQFSYS
jgi:uncharacterized protein YmfQ (DUF2313 family)